MSRVESQDKRDMRTVSVPDGFQLVPAEGKYAWAVAFGCFLSGMVCLAGMSAFSVLLVDLMDVYDSNTATVSWVMSIHSNIGKILAPLFTVITLTMGSRKTSMLGSLMISGGFAASYFADSIGMLCLTYGVIAGIGSGLCLVCHAIILSAYFRKYYGIAIGILLSSYSASRLVITPMVQYLLPEYGCRGVFLILGAFSLQSCLGSALFQPAHWHLVLVPINADCDLESEQGDLQTSTNNQPLVRSITESQGLSGTIPRHLESEHFKEASNSLTEQGKCWYQKICSQFDLDLLREPLFYVVLVNGLLSLSFTIFSNVFLFPLGVEKELTAPMLTSIVSAKAIVEIVFRIAGPSLMLLFGLKNQPTYIVLNIIIGVLLLVVASIETFPWFFTWVIVTGALFGATYSMSAALTLEAIGPERFAAAFGLMMFNNALFLIPMTPLMGWLCDTSGTFVSIFTVLGVQEFLTAALWIVKPFIRTSTSSKPRDGTEQRRPLITTREHKAYH